ncbi:sulfotransferase family 2 domain-containing protein [Patescibacteria group bacterium]|nr:sulfotransferase family 2 domain-containing protein [Patescibacteria group bacterium]
MIYLHHIRKTGGRSLIFSFLGLVGDAWKGWCLSTRSPALISGKLFQGWQPRPAKDAYLAWSHEPAWEVRIPRDTFTITILRGPTMRLVSHYRMLLVMQHLGETRFDKTEMTWMGQDILEFAERMPREHLQRQLYMFSPQYSVGEAAERIRSLSFYFRLEEYTSKLAELGQLLGLDLKEHHVTGRSKVDAVVAKGIEDRIRSELTVETKQSLRDLLEPEYELLSAL